MHLEGEVSLAEEHGSMKQLTLVNGGATLVDDDIDVRYGHCSWRRMYNGYVIGYVDRDIRTVFLHRLIMGAKKGMAVHHRNHDRLDNRRENLEIQPRGQHAGMHGRQRFYREAPKGAYFISKTGRWRAYRRINGRQIYLGCFATAAQAHTAWLAASEMGKVMPST